MCVRACVRACVSVCVTITNLYTFAIWQRDKPLASIDKLNILLQYSSLPTWDSYITPANAV